LSRADIKTIVSIQKSACIVFLSYSALNMNKKDSALASQLDSRLITVSHPAWIWSVKPVNSFNLFLFYLPIHICLMSLNHKLLQT